MTKVLGTPIDDARDDGRPVTVLLSDLHVKMDGGAALDLLREALGRAAERAEATRVLILGDLFEFLTGPRQLAVGAHREVVDALREAANAGVSLTVLRGNRDYMMDRAFERMSGARVVSGLRFALGGRPCLALHGDELCLNDVPYQRSKHLLRHPVTRGVLRNLPLGVSLWLGRRVRKKSKMVVASGDQERFHPVAGALRDVYGLEVDLLVFGHIHLPARGRFEDRGEYCILPAFEERGVHLEFEEGTLRYCGRGGEPLPDFPPRTFPELAAT